MGPGNLSIPELDRSCHTTKNPKSPMIGSTQFWAFFCQNFAKELEELRLPILAAINFLLLKTAKNQIDFAIG